MRQGQFHEPIIQQLSQHVVTLSGTKSSHPACQRSCTDVPPIYICMCVSPDFFKFFSRFRGVVTFSSKGVFDTGNSMVVSDFFHSLTFGSSKRQKIGIYLIELFRVALFLRRPPCAWDFLNNCTRKDVCAKFANSSQKVFREALAFLLKGGF